MRMTAKEMVELDGISARALGYGEPLTKDDIKFAVKHVRWLKAIGESLRACYWHGFYAGRFAVLGIVMPDVGADIRAITSRLPKGGGRPSKRPAYCTQKSVKSCRHCSLSSYGMDCANNKIGRTWGGV
jgi:hypothetical protein